MSRFIIIVALLISLCFSIGVISAGYQTSSWNNGAVENSPLYPTVLTFDTPIHLNYIETYHWNYGNGVSEPGTIGIKDENGNKYGPWQATGREGSGGVENAIWRADADVSVPAGTYTIIDSDPETWSHNKESGLSGFALFQYDKSDVQPHVTEKADPSDMGVGTHAAIKPGSIWKVKEYGPMGNWDGEWKVRDDSKTLDASWSGGSITDIIEVQSIEGNQITLSRHGNQGYYTGTISPDGLSISGTASWYTPGETWVVSVSSPGTGISPLPQPQLTPAASSTTAGTDTHVSGAVDGTVLANGAFILNANAEYEKAEKICNRALELDPGNPSVLSMKGWALIGLGRNEEALNSIDQALAIYPDDILALSNRAYCLANLGRCQEAAEVVAQLDSLATSDFEKNIHQDIISSCGQNS